MAFPGTHNISYYQGDTLEFTIRPKASDGSAFSLDGYSSKFFIADRRGPSFTVQHECTAVISNGAVLCTISPGVGRLLTTGTTYFYDVQVSKSANSIIHTLLTGTISVTADITGAA
jgi:hypothetical protein